MILVALCSRCAWSCLATEGRLAPAGHLCACATAHPSITRAPKTFATRRAAPYALALTSPSASTADNRCEKSEMRARHGCKLCRAGSPCCWVHPPVARPHFCEHSRAACRPRATPALSSTMGTVSRSSVCHAQPRLCRSLTLTSPTTQPWRPPSLRMTCSMARMVRASSAVGMLQS